MREILQNIIFPDPVVCTEQDMFMRYSGGVGASCSDSMLYMVAGGHVQFNTYFNSFSLEKWQKECTLNGLFLEIYGQGTFELKVIHASENRSWKIMSCEIIELSENGHHVLDISDTKIDISSGIIFFEIRALSTVKILKSFYSTQINDVNFSKLAIVITTFKREEAVEKTVSLLKEFLNDFKYKDNIHIFVIDNGQSANIKNTSSITYIPNKNLGGSGGFSRGLLEAQEQQYEHVIFTDDDASFLMESFLRTYMFLNLCKKDNSAVYGAMADMRHKSRLWENGALFDKKCIPLFAGKDLRDFSTVLQIETQSKGIDNKLLYGGWWFFAFPIKYVKHYPFPFFVRGDDVSFSLVNDFKLHSLNGVLSFQDSFTEKETPLTWYLDLRSHLAHHLSVPSMEISAHQAARIAIWFLLRNFINFHYNTMEAILLAWEDVMRGPDFFIDNLDMSERRNKIKELTNTESWKPIDEIDLAQRTKFPLRFRKLRSFVFRYLLNGHLLPFYRLFGNKLIINVRQRHDINIFWGASQITILNEENDKGYVTKMSSIKGLGLMMKALSYYVKFYLKYPELQKSYRNAYPRLTSKQNWSAIYSKTKKIK